MVYEVVIRKGLLLLHIANDGWFVLGHCYSSIDFFNPQKPGRHQRCTNTVVIFMVNDHFKGLSACGAGLIIIATHLFQVPTNLTGFLFPQVFPIVYKKQMFWKSIVYTFVCLNLGHLIKVSAKTFPIVRLNFYLKHVSKCESYIHMIIFITS